MSEQKELPIHKLPKWAQEHIAKIERERDVSIRALNEFVDSQTESEVYYDEFTCTGEGSGPSMKRRYVQTNRVIIEHAGIELSVYAAGNEIQLSWRSTNNIGGGVAFVPRSFMQAFLVSKENLRG